MGANFPLVNGNRKTADKVVRKHDLKVVYAVCYTA